MLKYQIILVYLCLITLANFILRVILKSAQKKYDSETHQWKRAFIQALFLPLSVWMTLFGVLKSLELFDVPFDISSFKSILNVLAVSWFLFRWKKIFVRDYRFKDRKTIDLFDKLSSAAIILFTLIRLVEAAGGNMGTLIALSGVGGLAMAFASQQVISNFFGGIMIYATRPFSIGDWISVPDKKIEGHVEEIGWYTTMVRTFDKKPIYIPNSIFTTALVMTPSRMSHRQIDQRLGLSYDDLSRIPQLLNQIRSFILAHEAVDKDLKPSIYLTSFGETSLNIKIVCFTPPLDGQTFDKVKEDILLGVAKIIASCGCSLASPTTYLNMPKPLNIEFSRRNPLSNESRL